jgi:hypothetical protein
MYKLQPGCLLGTMTRKRARQLKNCGLLPRKVKDSKRLSSAMLRPDPGSTQPPVLSALRVVSLGVCGQGMTPTIHVCPVSRVQKG